MGILIESFVSFGYWMGILTGSSVYFSSWMGILGKSFVSFGSLIGILAGSSVSFGSLIGIPAGSFVSFGSRIRIPAGFLLLRAHPKSDLYKDRLIFYRDSAALHGLVYVIASRNGSSFLSLMKEKNQKRIKAMIAIYFCLVHVVNGRCFVRLEKGRGILTWFLLLRALPKSDLYKDGLIFYHNNATLHGFSHVVASRNGSSFMH